MVQTITMGENKSENERKGRVRIYHLIITMKCILEFICEQSPT
jgi:hypothetical protein